MTGKEIFTLISRISFEAANVNYYGSKENKKEWHSSLRTLETLQGLAMELKTDITVIRTQYLDYAAVFGTIGKNKMFFSWCPACDTVKDAETWDEFTKCINEYKAAGIKCYVTDGNGGMTEEY